MEQWGMLAPKSGKRETDGHPTHNNILMPFLFFANTEQRIVHTAVKVTVHVEAKLRYPYSHSIGPHSSVMSIKILAKVYHCCVLVDC